MSLKARIKKEDQEFYMGGGCPQTPHTHDLRYMGFGEKLGCRDDGGSSGVEPNRSPR